ncbi:MAG TPA: diaminopimelate epimerase [Myxococcaceae bacterium]|nr:diaminopimelate epimerase [Myxococcaceae bacterium]
MQRPEQHPGGRAPERLFKYHGLGNDFFVLDLRDGRPDLDARTVRWICDRKRGLGADGVLSLLPSTTARAQMVVHNADGSIAEMCGNGLRCAVRYLLDHGERSRRFVVETGAGPLTCELTEVDGIEEIAIDMGPARLVDPAVLPAHAPLIEGPLSGFPEVRGTALSMGNPHLVLLDTPLSDAGRLGPQLEVHPDFPTRTNVSFVARTDEGLDVVVWERGCGLTDACGTGACASVATLVHLGRLAPDTWHRVRLPGGPLSIRVRADLGEVRLKGPATFVFEAVVALPPAH